jgi:hypothetical protein
MAFVLKAHSVHISISIDVSFSQINKVCGLKFQMFTRFESFEVIYQNCAGNHPITRH